MRLLTEPMPAGSPPTDLVADAAGRFEFPELPEPLFSVGLLTSIGDRIFVVSALLPLLGGATLAVHDRPRSVVLSGWGLMVVACLYWDVFTPVAIGGFHGREALAGHTYDQPSTAAAVFVGWLYAAILFQVGRGLGWLLGRWIPRRMRSRFGHPGERCRELAIWIAVLPPTLSLLAGIWLVDASGRYARSHDPTGYASARWLVNTFESFRREHDRFPEDWGEANDFADSRPDAPGGFFNYELGEGEGYELSVGELWTIRGFPGRVRIGAR